MCACLTWIPHCWNQLFGRILIHKNQVVKPLPYDVIANILSRLPADQVFECRIVCKEWWALISTPYFVEMHFKRSTPTLFMQCKSEVNLNEYNYFFFDKEAKKMMFKKIDCLLGQSMSKKCPLLVGLCNGLLLFRVDSDCSLILICNPITRERVTLRLPSPAVCICGFFFNSLGGDYCVLLYWRFKENEYNYAIYSHRAIWRLVGNFQHCPITRFPPSIVNGTLHWIVKHYPYGDVTGLRSCRESILTFNIVEEKFSVRPHPGQESCLWDRDRHTLYMRLLEMEEQLTLSNVYPTHIDIWVLEDYADWVWIKRYKVYQYHPSDINSCYVPSSLVNFQNSELLLIATGRLVIRYHLRQHTVRKIDIPKRLNMSKSLFNTSVLTAYNKSLISLKDL